MKTYLVTGGAGFIGSNFVDYILDVHGDDASIVILDALTYAGNLMTIADKLERDNVTFVHGDINDAELVSRLLAEYDPDYVVNFAAESHVDRSISNPRIFIETNVLGTQCLLECCRRAWLDEGRSSEGKKFLQISTDEVYGSLEKHFDTPQPLELPSELRAIVADRTDITTFGHTFFTETTPLAPRSPYSASKAAADMLVLAYAHTYGLPVNITRCSNNYGPYQFPEKLIPLMINNIVEGKPIPVYGRGLNVRDWLYVGDHCRAIDLVLRHGVTGEIYNIGGYNEHANIDLVRTVISLMREHIGDTASTPVDDSLITYVTDRPGHDMRYAIDPTKIATELGWYPATAFPLGIRLTIDWYMTHRQWIDSVITGEYRKYYDRMYLNR